MQVDEKQVAVIEKKIAPIAAMAQKIVIKTPEEMSSAAETLTQLNKYGDELEGLKKTVTDPLNKALKAARELFKPRETVVEAAVASIRKAMGAYQLKAEEKAAKEEDKIAKKVEAGTMSPEKAVQKMDQITGPVGKIDTAGGAVKFRAVKKLKILNEQNMLIWLAANKPELLTFGEKGVTDLLKAGIMITGATLEETREVVNSR